MGYRICSLNATMSGMEWAAEYGTRNRDGRREWQSMVCPMQNRGGRLKREERGTISREKFR